MFMRKKQDNKPERDHPFRSKELYREYKTVTLMIGLYCRKIHGHKNTICENCQNLLEYAEKRIIKCPHYASKIPCSQCRTHCYGEPYRSDIRGVMRYAGPRMIIYHPVTAVFHMVSTFKCRRANRRGET